MKKKIAAAVFLFLALIVIALFVTDQQHIYKTIWYNYPGIFDAAIFEKRIIQKSSNPIKWPFSNAYNKQSISTSLLNTLERRKSIAFLIIQNDSIVLEKYWNQESADTPSNSFSVAKSFVNAMIGRALKLGYIKSLDQKVAAFIPAFKTDDRRHITIRHLLSMSSGLNWDEAYSNLWSQTTKAYYGKNLEKQMLALSSVKKPGVYFEYKSCDTEVLAMVLTKATGMPMTEFFEKELWQPLGAETDAYWSLDHTNGLEKAYCCLYSNARDFARLGSLYLHQGNWKGAQLIDSSYVTVSITPSLLKDPVTNAPTDCYGYHWWTMPNYKGFKVSYMRGILGQYIIVLPELNVIIVRLGHERGQKIANHYSETYSMIDEVIRLNNQSL